MRVHVIYVITCMYIIRFISKNIRHNSNLSVTTYLSGKVLRCRESDLIRINSEDSR